ncbi:hypothetical protein D3C84_1116680 [compost metagenome]
MNATIAFPQRILNLFMTRTPIGVDLVEDPSGICQPNLAICTSSPDQWIMILVPGSYFDKTRALDFTDFKPHDSFLGSS